MATLLIQRRADPTFFSGEGRAPATGSANHHTMILANTVAVCKRRRTISKQPLNALKFHIASAMQKLPP
jgi:hypothetical protein